jgi:hypothetical protein
MADPHETKPNDSRKPRKGSHESQFEVYAHSPCPMWKAE